MKPVRNVDRVEDPVELTGAIAAALSGTDGDYCEVVGFDDPAAEERIALIRACGRKAGRQIGVTVRTAAADSPGILRFGAMVIATGSEGREVHVVATGHRRAR